MKSNVKKMVFAAMIMVVAITANAYDFKVDNLYYNILSNADLTVEVTRNYDSNYRNGYVDGDLNIPNKVKYNSNTYIVSKIDDYAFRDCIGLTSVTIPSSVISIGEYVFSGCIGLTEINVDVENQNYASEDGILYVKDKTTLIVCPGGKKGEIVIPNYVLQIGHHAFDRCCGLTSVAIPNSVTSIGNSAFYDCAGLKHITIPNSVAAIGEDVFYRCCGLLEVKIPSSIILIGNRAFDGCSSLMNVTIPGSVTTIGDCAFNNCSGLTSVTIPNSVTSIGNGAFSGCSGLTSVTIPNSVTSIGGSAFLACRSLTNVTIPNSVTAIYYSTFSGCNGLTNVAIPNSVILIDKLAFSGCSGLKCITIPNSVTTIDRLAFYDCNGLEEINVDVGNQNYTSIDGVLYTANKSTLINYPNGKKEEFNIPSSVSRIGDYAFDGCNVLKNITISSSVTAIGKYAFSRCSGMTSVTIPNSVTEIGSDAFSYCKSLKSIYCQWTEPIKCSPKFPDNALKNAVLYVPKGCTAAYEKVDPWRNFWNIEEIDYSAGVEDVALDGVEVKVVNGAVVAEGCAEMEVYSMSGQLVHCGAGRADNLAPGIYAVRAAGKTVKVLVGK